MDRKLNKIREFVENRKEFAKKQLEMLGYFDFENAEEFGKLIEENNIKAYLVGAYEYMYDLLIEMSLLLDELEEVKK